MKEREVKRYFLQRAEEENCIVRKVRWENRNGAPDWCLWYPEPTARPCCWVELKATGEKPDQAQLDEHKVMRAHGQWIVVVDSKASVDELFQ